MDTSLFLAINGLANHYWWLDDIGIFFATQYQYLLIVLLVVLLFIPKKERFQNRGMIIAGTIAVGFTRLIIKPVIVYFYYSLRPFEVLPQAKQLATLIATSENLSSFPSAHTMSFFSLGTAIYQYNKRWGIFFMINAVLISLSRIFVGVHWPSDVLGGMVIGIFVGWLVPYLLRDKIDSYL